MDSYEDCSVLILQKKKKGLASYFFSGKEVSGSGSVGLTAMGKMEMCTHYSI